MKHYVFLLLAFTALSTSLSAQRLSDAEIASVAVVANQVDIDYAEVAVKKSRNPEVLSFARTMKNDHAAVIKQAATLVHKLGVTPQSNAVSEKLQKDAVATIRMLNKKSGRSFDRAYVNNEVAYHKAVINAVESLLIPQSDNAELRNLLKDVLPALKAHLGHAEMLQKKIS